MFHHALTPGSGGYAVLKFGAVAGVFGLRFAMSRRSKGTSGAPAPAPEPEAGEAAPRAPHPRSKKKRQRRR